MKNSRGYVALAIALAMTAQGAFADDADASGAVRCISINKIKRTEVIDDQTILFYLHGDKVYRNHLPQRCNTLNFGNAFGYATSQSQLCNVDTITVRSQTTSEVLNAGCKLGVFVPVESKQSPPAD